MQIDRRITNGLAWAGALLVVAVPAADIALRQIGPTPAPQIAVVDPADAADTTGPGLPTPSGQRPAPAAVAAVPAETTELADKPDPVTTASTKPASVSGDVVADYLDSGRPLPSYISDGDSAPTIESAAVPDASKVTDRSPPAPSVEQVASTPRTVFVSFPTPVSQRPPSVSYASGQVQPPLVIETDAPVVTATDLAAWESGPLSDFLASRQSGSGQPEAEHDADGFFLDEGPNARSNARVLRFPRAYDGGFFSFD